MNTPNKLTVARIIATPFFMASMLFVFLYHYLVALVLFICASLTDLIDGKIARKRNLVTDFGKFLDPLADKMLTTAAYLGFISIYGETPKFCWQVTAITFIILFREFMVSSIRLIAQSSGGKVIAANIWGKAKTVSQMVGIIIALAAYESYVGCLEVLKRRIDCSRSSAGSKNNYRLAINIDAGGLHHVLKSVHIRIGTEAPAVPEHNRVDGADRGCTGSKLITHRKGIALIGNRYIESAVNSRAPLLPQRSELFLFLLNNRVCVIRSNK